MVNAKSLPLFLPVESIIQVSVSIKKNKKALKIMQFTPQQQQAIFTQDRHLIVTAGAGSGKTRVLVERFIHLLHSNPTWKLTDIVAITFTEKAAREMRDRIRRAIDKALADPQAEAHWREHQADLDAARITTIHGLCAQILRANPVEARLDPGFVVLDEVQARLLAVDAVEQSIINFIEHFPEQADTLLQYNTVRDVRFALQSLIQRSTVHDIQQALMHHTSSSDLLAYWQVTRQRINQLVIERLQQDEKFIAACYWIDDFDPAKLREDKLWLAWAAVLEMREYLLADDVDADEAHDMLTQLSSKQVLRLVGGSQKNWGDKHTVAESKRHLTIIREASGNYLSEMVAPLNALDELSAELTLIWQQLILLAADIYTRRKEEENGLDFDDLEYLTAQLLTDHPNVADRYANADDGEFKHMMVDEFQDTNAVQKQIVYALAGMHAPRNAGRLFVVGDPKQSIYAFRGADVSVFGDVRADIERSGGQVVYLNKSFRTHRQLVDSFNDLFSKILPPPSGPVADYMVDYDPMDAFRDDRDIHKPSVYLRLLKKADDRDVSDRELQAWEAELTAETIIDWVGNKVIWDREEGYERPMRFGDIALLFQSLNNARVFEDAFQAAGIPFITVGGRGYFERQEVWDVLNLLAVLYHPSDDLALATVLRSPMFGLSDDALLLLRLRRTNKKPLPLWQALLAHELDLEWPIIDDATDLRVMDFAAQVLVRLHQLAGRLTIAELISEALDATGFEATLLAMQDGELRRANVLKLLNVAQKQQHVSLSEFTKYIQDMTTFEAREGDAVIETDNTVQIMTVHKSKGLEFPMVILPRCDWSRNRSDSTPLFVDRSLGPVAMIKHEDAEIDDTPEKPAFLTLAHTLSKLREQAERRRLLYVAMTRAQDFMVLSAAKLPGKTATTWSWLTELLPAMLRDEWRKDLDAVVESEERPLEFEWGEASLDVIIVDDAVKRKHRVRVATTQAVDDTTAYETFPLLPKPEIKVPGRRLHVSATDLAYFGRVRQLNDPTATGEFKMRVLRDMPMPVKPVMAQHQRSMQTIIGNVVHHALQMQAILSDRLDIVTQRELLAGFAWEEGAIDYHQRKQVVDESVELLKKYASSELAQLVQTANRTFRELEFVFEHERYVIHGMIDLLFERDDEWYVVDYKTSRIPTQYTPDTYSRRYRYQMAAYAAAVSAQLGGDKVPHVMIYYLRGSDLYTMPEAIWREALDTLDYDLESTLNADL